MSTKVENPGNKLHKILQSTESWLVYIINKKTSRFSKMWQSEIHPFWNLSKIKMHQDFKIATIIDKVMTPRLGLFYLLEIWKALDFFRNINRLPQN